MISRAISWTHHSLRRTPLAIINEAGNWTGPFTRIRVEFPDKPRYVLPMRRFLLVFLAAMLVSVAGSALGATGQIIKVLPHLVDRQGRVALSPSLYERDAYQAVLRQTPEKRGGMRFDVQWKSRGAVWQPLRLKVEIRGLAKGDLPKEITIEKTVEKSKWFGRWTSLELSGEEYRDFGEITAWKVTLWEGEWPLDDFKSFLW